MDEILLLSLLPLQAMILCIIPVTSAKEPGVSAYPYISERGFKFRRK